MKETEYAYAVAFVRTLENRMLKKADYEALFSATSLEEALLYLLSKGYGEAATTEQTLNADILLKEELAYTWNEVEKACPEDAPFDFLLYPNDFHNLKTILKAVFSGTSHTNLMLKPYTIPPDVIHRAIANGKPESLPDMLKKSAAEAYHILAREGDGQLAEILLDKALFSAMSEAAKQSKNDFLIGWVDLNIAVMDMKIALRCAYGGKSRDFICKSMMECKRINADYLTDAAARDVSAVLQVFSQSGFENAAKAARESTGAFDRWCDNELIRYLQSARYSAFGFDPILGFLIGKQFELQAVRMILSGLKSGIPTETLRERLRETYV